MLQDPVRLFNTVRHLRRVQVTARLFRLLPKLPVSHVPLPHVEPATRFVSTATHAPSLTGPRLFNLLGDERDLDNIGWSGPPMTALWRYNQHYFDDLNAVGAADRYEWHLALIMRWLAEVPKGASPGWEPYPTSLRIVNWIKWHLQSHALPQAALESLALQTRWLAARLEWHLLGNHLFANAKALLFAGCFFAGPEATQWRTTALELIESLLDEHILEDGGHFERSTMYHAIAVEDMLDIVNLLRAYGCKDVDRFNATVAAMQRWMNAMCHPDGDIAFFNDAAFGIAALPGDLIAYADRIGISRAPDSPSCWLRQSGYVRFTDSLATLLIDMAPIGPDYLPGHAHADTLSFELSLGRQRFLVNSGTSVYESGAERQRQRGTAAHNTVAINNSNSSQIWSSFRVAQRARPVDISVDLKTNAAISAAHDGYRWLRGQPRHYREWQVKDKVMTIIDQVGGKYRSAHAWFHFHPAVSVSASPDCKSGVAKTPGGESLRWEVGSNAGAMLVDDTHHCRFGSSEATLALRVEIADGRLETRWAWN